MGLWGVVLNFSGHQKRKIPMIRNKAQIIASLLGAMALTVGTAAHAELPAAVSTAITAYQTDALAAIALVMAAGVTTWGLMKLASKLGWR